MFVIDAIFRALQASFFMFGEVLWPLALGFSSPPLSGVAGQEIAEQALTTWQEGGSDMPHAAPTRCHAGACVDKGSPEELQLCLGDPRQPVLGKEESLVVRCHHGAR